MLSVGQVKSLIKSTFIPPKDLTDIRESDDSKVLTSLAALKSPLRFLFFSEELLKVLWHHKMIIAKTTIMMMTLMIITTTLMILRCKTVNKRWTISIYLHHGNTSISVTGKYDESEYAW